MIHIGQRNSGKKKHYVQLNGRFEGLTRHEARQVGKSLKRMVEDAKQWIATSRIATDAKERKRLHDFER